jgi:hypothetical protein
MTMINPLPTTRDHGLLATARDQSLVPRSPSDLRHICAMPLPLFIHCESAAIGQVNLVVFLMLCQFGGTAEIPATSHLWVLREF